MKKTNIIYGTLCLIVVSMLSISMQAQMVITNITNQNIKDVLEEYFLGEGVRIDTTRPIYYNNQTVINNNQIGTFTNQDTSYAGKNIPIKKGLILATDACKNIAGGNEGRQNAIHGAATNSPSLYLSYQKYCNSDLNQYNNSISSDNGTFRDVAVLDFWVIPQACKMSFRYCFGSEEYPQYVCTGYNDFFGLYCDGPYDEDLNPYTENIFYPNPTNVAVIPGTYEEDEFTNGTPVMINTCNNGNSSSSCGIVNQQYFIDNRDKSCKTTKLGGYTRRLTTAEIQTVPGMKYHIQIAICNINDESLQSAVFLEAGSFSAEKINLEHQVTQTNNGEGYIISKNAAGDTAYVFIKGCSADTMILHANYVAGEDEPETVFYVTPSKGSSIVRGVDYEYFRIEDDETVKTEPAPSTVSIPEGKSMVKYLLNFYHNDNKAGGTIDTLYFISTDCNEDPLDTLVYLMIEPKDLTCSVEGGVTLCNDKLPYRDSIAVNIENAVSFANVTATRGDATIYDEKLANDFWTKDTIFSVKIPVEITALDDTASVTIHIEDYCGRFFDTTIHYKVIDNSTKATVDKDYICEGDSVMLSCLEAATYMWSAYPSDVTLGAEEGTKVQTLKAKPIVTTTYSVTTISAEGCIATDTVKVSVEPIIKAQLELYPKKVYYSDPQIKFTDLSDEPFDRLWNFGDMTESNMATGYHTYATDTTEDSHTYEVTLIVYNKAMCPDTARDSIQVCADFTIWIPNAFVPGSNNGTLSMFGPVGKFLDDWTMMVFNRWGTKVFEGHNQMWDGKAGDGGYVQQGTYVYSVLYKDGHGRPQRKTGTFAVLPSDEQ